MEISNVEILSVHAIHLILTLLTLTLNHDFSNFCIQQFAVVTNPQPKVIYSK